MTENKRNIIRINEIACSDRSSFAIEMPKDLYDIVGEEPVFVAHELKNHFLLGKESAMGPQYFDIAHFPAEARSKLQAEAIKYANRFVREINERSGRAVDVVISGHSSSNYNI